ncbi:hypothetical protein GO986_11025 [Deinococcus sp. HMF7620]|uniref:Uncharacterized protein n=1 Tax=Deinococcus arboris TaxID=2682977 RepID=A0A7C9MRK3_9DEIO|nr:hypothetical protein [Deinococcus arboris]
MAVNPDFAGSPAAGWVLREALGQGYSAVGALTGQGTFRARTLEGAGRPVTALSLGRPQPYQTDTLFLGQSAGLFHTQDHPHPGPRRFLGGFYGTQRAAAQPELFEMNRPLSDFDQMRWFPQTTAARGLPE